MENLPKNSEPNPRLLEARNRKAEGFLGEFLLPAVEQRKAVDKEDVLTWLRAYKEEHPGMGEDFDMGVVYGRILDRLRKYPATTAKKGEMRKVEFEQDLEVLELLEQLDLEWIDQKIEEQ